MKEVFSKYSKNAPPAVDKCEKESLFLHLLIARSNTYTSKNGKLKIFLRDFEDFSAINKVPLARLSFSIYRLVHSKNCL